MDSLNRFLTNLEVLAAASREYHFPVLLAELLRLPLWFSINLLNLFKQELTWWIVTFICCAIGLVFVGCAVALFLIALKGTIAYRHQHGAGGDDDGGASSAQHEGGSCGFSSASSRDDDDVFRRKYDSSDSDESYQAVDGDKNRRNSADYRF